jgi:ABC-type branched-subunit amino acid transport system ATPase component
MTVLEAQGVTAGYGPAPVVQDVSVSVQEGEVVAIVGPNGAGKSTLLKSLFGLLRLMAGTVRIAGRDVSGWPPHQIARHGLAYVPQVENVFPSMSIVENLEMGGFTRKGPLTARIDEVLDIFPDLREAGRKQAGQLSGGQRNMLGMARALMLEPRALLLDEPTAGLSPVYTRVVWDQIGRIAAMGTAVVVVEQNVDIAVQQAHRVYVMVAGRNRLEGPAAEVAAQDLPSIFLGGDGRRPSVGSR